MPPELPASPAAAASRLAAALSIARTRERWALAAAAGMVAALTLLLATGIAVLVARRGLMATGSTALLVAPILLACAAGAWCAWRRRASVALPAIAAAIERRAPGAGNLVITAEQIAGARLDVSPLLGARILEDAERIVALDNEAPFHATTGTAVRTAAAAACVVVALALAASVPSSRAVGLNHRASPAGTHAPVADGGIEVRIAPPAYTRRPTTSVRNPERLDLIAGTRIEIAATDDAATLNASMNGEPIAAPRSDTGRHVVEVRDDGALVVDVQAGGRTERRAIPVTVSVDPAPVVVIARPGRDLLVDDVTAGFDVGINATDDLALSSLRLRYTKVSGSGEQFAFEEGELPVVITKASATSWSGRARIDLSAHRLVPGDLLAYRAIARDERPAGDEGASDTYVIRVAQPGDVASAGFAIDEDENRFALSQQMLLVKTERLHAQLARLAPDDFAGRASGLAVEQRMIRNEFSFMVGGEVEDEEEEAAHSHELQEGRDDNRGRRDVLSAIRAMSRAEQWLLRANTGDALPQVREAVEALQRAFSRTRYLLRTLPIRARIDLERRLSGESAGSASSRRLPVQATERERVAATLRIVARIDTALRQTDVPGRRTGLLDIASAIAALDPRSVPLAEAARLVLDATRVAASPDLDASRATLGRAATILSDDARRRLAAPLQVETRATPAANAEKPTGRRP